MTGSSEHWSYEWIEEYDIRNSRQVPQLFKSSTAVRRLYELSLQAAEDNKEELKSSDSEGVDIIAGFNMDLSATGGGVDRAGAAESGEGGVVGEPVGVVAGGDEKLGGGVDADAVPGQERGSGRLDSLLISRSRVATSWCRVPLHLRALRRAVTAHAPYCCY
jgi:hypothetical protein